MNSGDFFDGKNSLSYDKYYSGHFNFSKILCRFCKGENPRVLEIGIGTGNEAQNLLTLADEKHLKINLYGLDNSRTLLRLCRRKLDGKVTLLLADAEKKIPLCIKFDLIYMAFVYHLIENKKRLFKECHRLLKKGGALVIYSSSHYDLKHHILNDYFPSKYSIDTKRYISEMQLKSLLTETRFKNFRKMRLIRDHNMKLDDNFVEGVSRGVSNSVMQIIKKKMPYEYRRGVELMRNDISKNKRFDVYKTVYIVDR